MARWLPYVPYGGLPDPYLAHTRGDFNRISFPARKCAYRIKEHAPAEDPRHIKPWVLLSRTRTDCSAMYQLETLVSDEVSHRLNNPAVFEGSGTTAGLSGSSYL